MLGTFIGVVKSPKLFMESSYPPLLISPIPCTRGEAFLRIFGTPPLVPCVYSVTFIRHIQIDDEGRLLEASVTSVIGEAFYSADGYLGRCLSWRRDSFARFHAFDNMAAEVDDDRERKIRGLRRDGSDGGR